MKSADLHVACLIFWVTEWSSSNNAVQAAHIPNDFDEKYELLEKLGSGGFSTVYKVKEKWSGAFWAAKIVSVNINDSDWKKDLAPNEINIMKRLDHEALLKLHDSMVINSTTTILVIELMLGGPLSHLKYRNETPVPESRAKDYIRQVLQGVQYMHKRRICHNDIYGGNVLLISQNDTRIKIIDFGFSEEVNDSKGQPICADDMQSVGHLTYYLLTGNEKTISGVHVVDSTRKQLDFSSHRWRPQWKEAKNFIDRLLNTDKAKRSSAEEALNHPWLSHDASILMTN